MLLHDPKVLLLDEPASGLDPRARIEIRELLKELHRMGKTIIISSHILPELAELCNTVGIIEQGELIFSGPIAEILHRPRLGMRLCVGVAGQSDRADLVLRNLPQVTNVQAQNGRLMVELKQRVQGLQLPGQLPWSTHRSRSRRSARKRSTWRRRSCG